MPAIRTLVALTTVFALATADKTAFSSPAKSAHKNTSPKLKVWKSTELMNPLPAASDLAITLTKPVDESWLKSTLYWSPGEDTTGPHHFSEFQIWRSQDEGNFSLRGYVPTTQTSFVDDKIVFDSTYHYKVRLMTEMGMGPWSEIFTTTTPKAPTGYTRPPSNTSPSQRMKKLREEIRAAEEAKERVPTTDPADDSTSGAAVTAIIAAITTAAAAAAATTLSNQSATTTTTPSVWAVPAVDAPTPSTEHDDDDWAAHMLRLSKTQENRTDCADNDATCNDEASQPWYFGALFDKIIGSTATLSRSS